MRANVKGRNREKYIFKEEYEGEIYTVENFIKQYYREKFLNTESSQDLEELKYSVTFASVME